MKRDSKEVTCRFGVRTVPEGANGYNTYFDVTANENINCNIYRKSMLEDLKKKITIDAKKAESEELCKQK